MRWTVLAISALAFLGCDLLNENHDQIVTVTIPPPCCPDGTGQALSVTGFRCARIVNGQGLASSCRVDWTGSSGPFDLRATRSSDGLVSEHPGVTQGSTLNPGPAGAGGGTWTMELLGPEGQVLATATVALDS